MVAGKVRGPGFDSSSYKMVFVLSPRHKEVGKMDPDMINSVILHIHVDTNRRFLAAPSSGKLVYVQGLGVKNSDCLLL